MRQFFKTVAIVTVFSVCEKFLGFVYRIYLSRSIGAEGVGMYQVALSVFAFLLIASCSGTPITVSRLMTKYKSERQSENVFKVITAGLLLTLVTVLPVCALCYVFGDKFSFLFADERCLNIFFVLLPGLVFTSLYSVLRGVFWGNKDFMPYSVIELLEEICMMNVGIILINRAVTAYDGAFRASVAVLASYVFSFSLATAVFFIRKNKLKNPKGQLKPIFVSAAPVTAMRTATSLSVSLVSIILPLQLVKAGCSRAEAMILYGAALGQAMPILSIPTTLISSFIIVLVPEISESFYGKKNRVLKTDVEKAIKFTTLLTLVFIPVFTVCGEEAGIIVFNSSECGKFLSASAFLMVFMGLSSVSTSILNSIGLEKKSLLITAAGGALMLLSVWLLPRYTGIYSLLIGLSCIYGLTTVLNLSLIKKQCPEKPSYTRFLFKACAATFPAVILGAMLEKMLLPYLGTTFTFFVCAAVLTLFTVLIFFGLGLVDFSVIKGLTPKLRRTKKRRAEAKRA